MFDEAKKHGITIDVTISLCYYIRSSKYVIVCFNTNIYKEFFSLVCLVYINPNRHKLTLARRSAKRNRHL